MSHGSQKMNGILQDVGRGTHQVVAARYTFRRLFLAGLTALLADAAIREVEYRFWIQRPVVRVARGKPRRGAASGARTGKRAR